MELDDAGALGGGIATVGAAGADPGGASQSKQKRVCSGISAEQRGHLAIEPQLYHRGGAARLWSPDLRVADARLVQAGRR